nr:MAG TPA: conotoxin [Caudoviricetes sp.]
MLCWPQLQALLVLESHAEPLLLRPKRKSSAQKNARQLLKPLQNAG